MGALHKALKLKGDGHAEICESQNISCKSGNVFNQEVVTVSQIWMGLSPNFMFMIGLDRIHNQVIPWVMIGYVSNI